MVLPIDIPRRATHCASKQELLVPGQLFYSLLLSNEENEVIRKDFCLSCWEEEGKSLAKEKPYWKGVVPEPAPKKRVPKEWGARALFILKELLEAREKAQECFALALYLIRRKKISLQKEYLHNGKVYWLCHETGSEEQLLIPKEAITRQETENLREKVASLLHLSPI